MPSVLCLPAAPSSQAPRALEPPLPARPARAHLCCLSALCCCPCSCLCSCAVCRTKLFAPSKPPLRSLALSPFSPTSTSPCRLIAPSVTCYHDSPFATAVPPALQHGVHRALRCYRHLHGMPHPRPPTHTPPFAEVTPRCRHHLSHHLCHFFFCWRQPWPSPIANRVARRRSSMGARRSPCHPCWRSSK